MHHTPLELIAGGSGVLPRRAHTTTIGTTAANITSSRSSRVMARCTCRVYAARWRGSAPLLRREHRSAMQRRSWPLIDSGLAAMIESGHGRVLCGGRRHLHQPRLISSRRHYCVRSTSRRRRVRGCADAKVRSRGVVPIVAAAPHCVKSRLLPRHLLLAPLELLLKAIAIIRKLKRRRRRRRWRMLWRRREAGRESLNRLRSALEQHPCRHAAGAAHTRPH